RVLQLHMDDAAQTPDATAPAARRQRAAPTGFESGGVRGCSPLRLAGAHHAQRGDAGCRAERVGVEGAGVVDGSGEEFEDGALAAAAEAWPAASRSTLTESDQPWKCWSNFTMYGRPVAARASLMDSIAASVPEAVKRTSSALGTREVISSAHSTSSGLAAPKWVPRSTCCCTAATTSGWA